MIYSDLSLLNQEITKFKNQWKTVVWTNGCFDIIHPGHIENFKKCREFGDIVIVWLNGDASPYWKEKPWRPINNENFRSLMLDAIRYIDYVYIYDEETPLTAIESIVPDVLIKWWDYEVEKIVGYDAVTKNGGKVLTIPVLWNYSTTSIIQKIIKVYK